MKSSFLKLFACLGCIIFTYSSCEKEKTRWEQPLDPAFLEYVYFKKGTVWTYEDTLTQGKEIQEVVHDSIIKSIVEPQNRNKEPYGVDVAILSKYQYEVETNLQNNTITFSGGSICLGTEIYNNENTCFLAKYDKYESKFSDGPLYCPYFRYKPELNDPIASSTKTVIKEYHDNLDISGNTYPDVYYMEIPENPQENGMDTRIWVSKNHGIIRKVIKTDDLEIYPSGWQVWDLVDYHIVQ